MFAMSAGDKGVMSRTCLCGTSWLQDGTERTATCSVGSATISHTTGNMCTRKHSSPRTVKTDTIGSVWQAIKWLAMSKCSWLKSKGN